MHLRGGYTELSRNHASHVLKKCDFQGTDGLFVHSRCNVGAAVEVESIVIKLSRIEQANYMVGAKPVTVLVPD